MRSTKRSPGRGGRASNRSAPEAAAAARATGGACAVARALTGGACAGCEFKFADPARPGRVFGEFKFRAEFRSAGGKGEAVSALAAGTVGRGRRVGVPGREGGALAGSRLSASSALAVARPPSRAASSEALVWRSTSRDGGAGAAAISCEKRDSSSIHRRTDSACAGERVCVRVCVYCLSGTLKSWHSRIGPC
ncbi:hypothetical protein T492DRAFT_1121460 [Pavlovales sp. CCMP2436]|nr:hypothetical protein T492DRAFT_1121460 [Pavlovales sp. CCMP2436]